MIIPQINYNTQHVFRPEIEYWKELSDVKNMFLSSFGKLKSSQRTYINFGKTRLVKDHSYNHRTNNRGYNFYSFTHNNSKKTRSVHRLVAKAFIPNPLDKPHVNHKDGNKTNNRASNLEWCTTLENTLHACINGKIKNMLSKEQIAIADKMYAQNAPYSTIAAFLKAHPQSVKKAIKKQGIYSF